MGVFVLKDELINDSYNELGKRQIKIIDMDQVDDYLFIILDNEQKIITNGKEIYDMSNYNHLENIFSMQDKLCAVMIKGYDTTCVVDLKTTEVLFEDNTSYHVSKQDERTLHVMKKINKGNDAIYDIETKRYLKVPDHYEFEISLGDNLYVFREQHDSEKDFYDYKRCVINADGKILLKDIDGWIEQANNHLIIKKTDKLCIIKINEDATIDMKTIEQNKKIIAKPSYNNGILVLIEKGAIKTYTPDLELVNQFIIDGLDEVIDYEIISDTLKLCLPYTIDKEQLDKLLFINLNTGKSISHLHIEGYPYWNPTTYIGQDNIDFDQDSMDSKITDYHFYNAKFDKIIKVSAKSYESVESNKECMFVIKGLNNHKQLLNAENGSIRDIDYDYVHFHLSLPYGYGVNLSAKKMDFFDENLNIVIPSFDYTKFDLGFQYDKFNYFIINDYICIQKHFVGNFGQSRWRTIIQRANGEVILDSTQHKCYAIGNLIQIIHDKNSIFLNTLTGEIGPLEITASTDENGKIDFQKIRSADQALSLENNIAFKFSENEEDQKLKVKKLLHE